MNLKGFINTVSAIITPFLVVFAVQPAFAQSPVPSILISPPSTIGDLSKIGLNELIAFVINGIIVIGIVLSLIFLLYGGIRWILSGGDKGKVDSARGTIVAAIVGLIIVILAYVIINVVLQIFTGKNLTSGFCIPSLTGKTC